jgi:hypothetical protein
MDAKTARTLNIRKLVEAKGGPTVFASLCLDADGQPRWVQAQVSQWISEDNPKTIGDRLARSIEQAVGLPHGELDRQPVDESQPVGLDVPTLESAIRFIGNVFRAKGHTFDAERHSPLIAQAYKDMKATDAPDLVSMAIRYGKAVDDVQRGGD